MWEGGGMCVHVCEEKGVVSAVGQLHNIDT